ncbi:hypothetical protein J2Z35_002251 [Acetoanaerobium pronyense]|uniref:DUF3298 domain-containing protein n=1 Tax=Acetoanaerobium pronyense TaxID=1482736 RepID=A0ABS4KL12_9FIRM|nr:DUF3298 domain-containing protein [Acetoanaerobium pronyense]MBP2028448.1 hypothetical protein [Acetoanaerobium pronyense]
MRNLNDLEKARDSYKNIEIPEELEFEIRKTIKNHTKKQNKNKVIKRVLTTAAVVGALFVGSVNLSPNLAYAISEIPGMANLVRVVSIRDFTINENNFIAEIDTPKIEGLEDGEIQELLNSKYIEENKALYEEFVNDMNSLKEDGHEEAHMGVFSGFEVVTDNEDILSIERYVVNVVGSSSTVLKYDTIDKNNRILITLPSLFKDESYIQIISDDIKSQMKSRMNEDEDLHYWLEDEIDEFNFKEIDKNQNFYINEDYKLVISFDKYEVGPGYMGVQEFIIPTEILNPILVSNMYIK